MKLPAWISEIRECSDGRAAQEIEHLQKLELVVKIVLEPERNVGIVVEAAA